MSDRIPVTILSGALGAGKTTTLNHLLEHNEGHDIAVLVNDMGEINVDAELLSTGSELSAATGIAELSNGCICCERQDDLETEVSRLARSYDFEYLVVEASGISEPAPIARLFTTESRAAARYAVDTTVTVVDARSFYDAFLEGEVAGEGAVPSRETAPGDTDRPLSDLLIEQVEFADVVLCNKTDLLSETEREGVREVIRTLQPEARVHETTFGAVEAEAILGTGLFDPRRTGERAGWKRAFDRAETSDGPTDQPGVESHDSADEDGHEHDADHSHDHQPHSHGHHDHAHDEDGTHEHTHRSPADVYGVTSVAFRRNRPLDPERFRAFLESLPANVIRAKGRCWVAGRDETVQVLNVAGRSIRIETAGRWIASLPERERSLYRANRTADYWHPTWGDREVRLVFIGRNLNESELESRLDDCLVADQELSEDDGTTESWADAAREFPDEDGDVLVVR